MIPYSIFSHLYCGILVVCLTLVGGSGCSSNATSSEGRRVAPEPPQGSGSSSQVVATPSVAAPKTSLPLLEGDHHEVFSLRANRLLAHLVREGGLAIAAGDPGVAKYVTFGRPWNPWELGARVDGRRVALASRSESWFSVPLTAKQAGAAALTLRLNSPGEQGLRVTVNGTRLETAKLAAGWQRVRVAIPPKLLRAGENRISFGWGQQGKIGGEKAYAAVDWLHLGDRAPAEGEKVTLLDGDKLWLPARGGLAFYVHPYAGAKLRLAFDAQPPAKRCALEVTLSARGGQPQVVTRSETGLSSGRSETFVDLAPVAGKVARLELGAVGDGCGGMTLSEAAIVMPGPAPKLQRDKRPRHVLFWLIDNARADRYRAYNPKTRVTTPVIDKLIETGTVFTRAYIAGTESRVSHASIWTGLYPKQHNFIAAKATLSSAWITLPEAVKAAGLTTAGWTANGFVSARWGFGEGWDQYRNTIHEGGGLDAKSLADHAIKYIEKNRQRPFYLYVGTIDPHVSWRTRQPWVDRYYGKPYSGKYEKAVYGKDVEKMATGKIKVTDADKQRILAIYDGTVSYNDHHLGRVLAALEQAGIRDETMIVVTADHGEELWDFGKIGHGHSLRQALVAVPLIINYPPLFGKGVRVTEGVDALSVMPTVIDAVGGKVPDAVQAGSLVPLAQGVGRGYPRPSLATQYELAHTIQLEDYKLWVGGKGTPSLYDLASARAEHEEISKQRPLATRWLTDALGTFLIYQDRWRQSRWGVASNQLPAMPDDLESGKGPPPVRVP